MNMFDIYDSLNDHFMAGDGPGTPVIPTIESVKTQSTIDNMAASNVSNPQAKQFPIEKVLITAGIIVLGFIIFKALNKKNDTSYTYSERRRLARQRTYQKD